jgi:hypothetical protein
MDNTVLPALLVFGCLLAIALIGLFTSSANARRLNSGFGMDRMTTVPLDATGQPVRR